MSPHLFTRSTHKKLWDPSALPDPAYRLWVTIGLAMVIEAQDRLSQIKTMNVNSKQIMVLIMVAVCCAIA